MSEITEKQMRERAKGTLLKHSPSYCSAYYAHLIVGKRGRDYTYDDVKRRYHYGWSFDKLTDKEVVGYNQPCHALLFASHAHPKNKITFLASNISSDYVGIPKEVSMKFFEWITDKEKSPWRHAFEGEYEVIEDKGALRGVIFDPETLANYPSFFYWFNVCSVMRQSGIDGRSRVPVWNALVEEGIDPSIALILSERFTWGNGVIQEGIPNSNHRPTWDSTSFIRMNNADWTPDVNHQENLFMGDDIVPRMNVKKTKLKSRFGEYYEYNTADIKADLEKELSK